MPQGWRFPERLDKKPVDFTGMTTRFRAVPPIYAGPFPASRNVLLAIIGNIQERYENTRSDKKQVN
jgi:hypothetical protein